jgi:asparagine synthase (glutamine-hydrolysing)
MCAIVGYCAIGKKSFDLKDRLPHALAALAHRGPDGKDVWFDPNYHVGLGHARLSILDISAAATQPMVSKDQRWVMVFNGEVYNFAQIRAQLNHAGVGVRSTGDSEVILEALALWGMTAIQKFVGMFAIALWDRKQNELFLIRDRAGVKPLYYSLLSDGILFASELKGLQSFNCFARDIDKNAVGEYLRYGYLSEATCIYKNSYKVQPGTWVKFSASGQRSEHRYWSPDSEAVNPDNPKLSDSQWTERIEHLVKESTALRMVSDVPIGVFLSGGVDSSLVTALAQLQSSQRVKTFTIGFDDEQFNEAPFARDVAAHLGTDHQEFIFPARAALEMLPKWGKLFDEPFGDSSGLPTFMVSQMAANSVKVVLSADGGDELFNGYGRYSILQDRGRKLESIPTWLRSTASVFLNQFPVESWDDRIADRFAANGRGHSLRYQTSFRATKIKERIGLQSSAHFYDAAHAYLSPAQIHRLIGTHGLDRRSCASYLGSAVEQFAQWDFDYYLPGDILTKVDRATMATSIEGREPLLDHRLVEAAFALPLHLKRGPLGPKHILKDILYRYVPRTLVDRPKRGFAVPMNEWLLGPLRPFLRDTLLSHSSGRDDLLNPLEVRRLVKRFESGDYALTTPIWLMLSLELWRREWART